MSALIWEPAAPSVPGEEPDRVRRLIVVPHEAPQVAAPGRLCLTRRGRLVVVAALLALVAVVCWLAVGRAAGSPPAPRTVTVSTGQTLSEIASIQLPHVPVDNGIAAIRLANRLASAQVHAGQRLVIPTP
ncbi:MAG: LysM peptidoglycan-binding domain-containing protein [Dermatophilaceae bacterium]